MKFQKFPMLLTILQLLFWLSPIINAFQCDVHFDPIKYDVTFEPNLETMEVNGELFATMIVSKATNTITLNKSPGMTITDLQVNQSRRIFGFESVDEDYENGFKYHVVLNNTLDENWIVTIRLNFWYKSDGRRNGFYIGEMSPGWKEYYSSSKEFAASYLDVTGCQNAFPCVNCPLDSVRFKIRISTPCFKRDCMYTTVSSTTIEEINAITGRQMFTYSGTPRLSYRNLAFFVSPFRPIKIEKQIIYSRIWGENDESVVTFGKTVQKLVNFFETLLNVKLDHQLKHVVVPDKFYPANVAVYYAVIFYKEPYMAVDYDLSRQEKRRKISGAVSRQFFTNLRHDIYEQFGQFSAETFGKYFEYIEVLSAAQWKVNNTNEFLSLKYIPYEWKISDTFTVDVLQTAMATYKDEASVLYKPTKAHTMLLKSAAYLRFFEHLLTTPVFVKALKRIVKKQFVLTDMELLNIFKPYFVQQLMVYFPYHEMVYKMMKTPGYPVVTVSRDDIYEKSSTILTQQWYTQFPHQPSDKVFHIPVSFSIIGESFETTQPNILVNNKTVTYACEVFSCKLAIFNTQQTGFYRVNYDLLTWTKIIQNLRSNHTSIHVLNRAQLIDDAFALADGDLLPYRIPLELSLYLRNETSVAPWIAFFRGIRSVELWFNYCGKQIATTRFENYVHDLILSAFGESFAEDFAPSEEYIRLKSLALSYLCKYYCVVCQTIAQNIFLTKNLVKPDISLLDSVYCWALKFEHPLADWSEFRDEYKKSVLIGDEVAIKVYRKAVACGMKHNQVMWFLNYAVAQGFKGSKQEATNIFLEVIESAENGYRLTLRYLTVKIHNVYQSIYLSKVLLKLAEVTFLPSQVVEFSNLIKHVVSYTKIEPLMRQLERNGNWAVKNHDHLTSFLETQHLYNRLEKTERVAKSLLSAMKYTWVFVELFAAIIAAGLISFGFIHIILKFIIYVMKMSFRLVGEILNRIFDLLDELD